MALTRRLHLGDARSRCQAADEIAQRQLFDFRDGLAQVMGVDADGTIRTCVRDAFAALLRAGNTEQRRQLIYSVGSGGPDGWELLQRAADNDPDQEDRKIASDVLAWRQRQARENAQGKIPTNW